MRNTLLHVQWRLMLLYPRVSSLEGYGGCWGMCRIAAVGGGNLFDWMKIDQ